MKPDGRALDLTVIGLGQAGGNLATEFFRRGYRALALNTAQTDLSALDPGGVYPTLPPERRIYIGLDGYDGAGMDPVYAAECVRTHADQLRAMIRDETQGADAVILSAGLGGGTGSAVHELATILEDENLPVIALCTLPTQSESGIVKVNAVKAINQIVNAPVLGWIFIDNERIAELNQDVSIIDYYAHINGRIASPIDGFNRLNSREDLSAIRSFDGEDFRKLLLAGGMVNYAVVEIPSVTAEEVVGAFRDCLEVGDLMPPGFDVGSISYVGIVIEAPEAIHADTSIGTFEDIDRQIKQETGGAAVYRGIYRSNDEDSPPTLRIIASSQGLPTRVSDLLLDAQREGEAIRNKLREPLPMLELGEIENFELFPPGARSRSSERPRRRERPSAPPLNDLQAEIVQPRRPAASTLTPRPKPQLKASERAQALRRADPPQRPKPSMAPPRRKKPEEVKRADARRVAPRATPASLPIRSSKLLDERGPEDETVDASQLIGVGSDGETGELDMHEQLAVRGRRPTPPPPPPSDRGLDSTEIPNPEVYDKLVSEFLHAPSDSDREEIALRLEEDSLSEHTIVRYYAVEAMSKLGPEDFFDALQAASDDHNEAVRALATEALRRGTRV